MTLLGLYLIGMAGCLVAVVHSLTAPSRSRAPVEWVLCDRAGTPSAVVLAPTRDVALTLTLLALELEGHALLARERQTRRAL